jgi:hypothetical protein
LHLLQAYSKEDGHDDSMTAEGATVFELERALGEQQRRGWCVDGNFAGVRVEG